MTYQSLLFSGFRDKAFTMSYDDGVRQDLRLIDIMQKNGLKGTFNINSGLTHWEDRIKLQDICDVYLKTGNEVAVHGVKHLTLAAITEERMEDVLGDRKAL